MGPVFSVDTHLSGYNFRGEGQILFLLPVFKFYRQRFKYRLAKLLFYLSDIFHSLIMFENLSL